MVHCQAATSALQEMAPGTRFRPVLDDPLAADKSTIGRVVFCTGKLYYDLIKERSAREGASSDHVALVRIEELSPFPFAEVQEVFESYGNASEFFWVQEEPRNQGAYAHVAPRLTSVLQRLGRSEPVLYRGRAEGAVPAPGIAKIYAAQQKAVIEAAFEALT